MPEPSTAFRLRFPPSPTGHWHLGGARTALFNWLYARQNRGQFILRIEDTDRERSKREYEIELAETMKWLGLDWDEGPDWRKEGESWKTWDKGESGPYRQTERVALYKKYLEQLLSEGKAYFCYCTKEELEAQKQSFAAEGLPPKYSGRCRELKSPPPGREPQLIRFKTPAVEVEFDDLIRGRVKFDTGLFDDFVLARSPESPLYNFAAVVDDHEMKITHVVRGEEHLSNTPKQILIYRALGFSELPKFGHLPLILAADRTKLSKRYAETAMLQYREDGYLPEAMLNFLALLGWHPKEDREVLTREELLAEFDLARVQKAGAVFDPQKLNWLNIQHIKRLSDEEIARRLAPFWPPGRGEVPEEKMVQLVRLERDRAKTLKDFVANTDFIFELPDYEPKLLVWKNDTPEHARKVLEDLLRVFESAEAADLGSKDALAGKIELLIAENGKGQVFWPLRVAVSGLAASPDPLDISVILGKEETLRRLRLALNKINA